MKPVMRDSKVGSVAGGGMRWLFLPVALLLLGGCDRGLLTHFPHRTHLAKIECGGPGQPQCLSCISCHQGDTTKHDAWAQPSDTLAELMAPHGLVEKDQPRLTDQAGSRLARVDTQSGSPKQYRQLLQFFPRLPIALGDRFQFSQGQLFHRHPAQKTPKPNHQNSRDNRPPHERFLQRGSKKLRARQALRQRACKTTQHLRENLPYS